MRVAKEVMSTDYVKVDVNDPISKLIGKLMETHERGAVVFDGKKYKGVLGKKWILKSKVHPASMRVREVTVSAPKLKGDEPIEEVARLLLTANTYLLPVLEDGKVVGVVKAINVVKVLKERPEGKKKVKEIATRKPFVLHERDRVGKAIEIYREEGISRLPLVDNEGKLVGIFNFTDLIEKYILKQAKSDYGSRSKHTETKSFDGNPPDLRALEVIGFKAPILVTVNPDATISEVIDDLVNYNINSVIVEKELKPVGIVTITDLLKLFLPPERLTY